MTDVRSATSGQPTTRAGVNRLLDPSVLADPYPVYEEWRQLDADPAGTEVARIIVGHDDAKAALRDPRLSSWRPGKIMGSLSEQAREELPHLRAHIEANIVFNDPPAHTRLRKLMNRAFTARMVEQMRPTVQAVTDELLDRALERAGEERGRMDLLADLAYPLPALVIGAILGIDRADQTAFRQWAQDMVFFVASGRRDDEKAHRIGAGVVELRAYMNDLCARVREGVGGDDAVGEVLTALMDARDEGGSGGGERGLSDVELYANAQFLMTAGHETATNMLCNTMLALLAHPDQLDRLRADPALVPTAVDEGLRYESPVQMTARIATEDCTVARRPLQAGESVIVALGAANRDPSVFDGPERFDVGREPNPHLAFGHGAHFCLGAPLARLEGEIVLSTVLARIPQLALAVDRGALEWQATTDFRGPVAMPVTVGGGHA